MHHEFWTCSLQLGSLPISTPAIPDPCRLPGVSLLLSIPSARPLLCSSSPSSNIYWAVFVRLTAVLDRQPSRSTYVFLRHALPIVFSSSPSFSLPHSISRSLGLSCTPSFKSFYSLTPPRHHSALYVFMCSCHDLTYVSYSMPLIII